VPTYSYKCTECGNAFDIKQSFSDASLTECPSCGGPLRKVFGAVGVTFNGSGFYRNDSRATPKSSGSDGAAGGAKKDHPKKDGAKKDAAASTGSSSSSSSSSQTSSTSGSKAAPAA
jgi:putative regulatory protein, FmdB family